MSVARLHPFPSHFRLKDLTAVSAHVFEFKLNPYQEQAARTTSAWFDRYGASPYMRLHAVYNFRPTRCNVYHGKKKTRFLSHRFDSYAGMSFPDADLKHLETCTSFFLWAFSVSDRHSHRSGSS